MEVTFPQREVLYVNQFLFCNNISTVGSLLQLLFLFRIGLQVRSLTLDVKVWEPSIISLFQSLGNAFANSVWEELLQSRSTFQADLIPTG